MAPPKDAFARMNGFRRPEARSGADQDYRASARRDPYCDHLAVKSTVKTRRSSSYSGASPLAQAVFSGDDRGHTRRPDKQRQPIYDDGLENEHAFESSERTRVREKSSSSCFEPLLPSSNRRTDPRAEELIRKCIRRCPESPSGEIARELAEMQRRVEQRAPMLSISEVAANAELMTTLQDSIFLHQQAEEERRHRRRVEERENDVQRELDRTEHKDHYAAQGTVRGRGREQRRAGDEHYRYQRDFVEETHAVSFEENNSGKTHRVRDPSRRSISPERSRTRRGAVKNPQDRRNHSVSAAASTSFSPKTNPKAANTIAPSSRVLTSRMHSRRVSFDIQETATAEERYRQPEKNKGKLASMLTAPFRRISRSTRAHQPIMHADPGSYALRSCLRQPGDGNEDEDDDDGGLDDDVDYDDGFHRGVVDRGALPPFHSHRLGGKGFREGSRATRVETLNSSSMPSSHGSSNYREDQHDPAESSREQGSFEPMGHAVPTSRPQEARFSNGHHGNIGEQRDEEEAERLNDIEQTECVIQEATRIQTEARELVERMKKQLRETSTADERMRLKRHDRGVSRDGRQSQSRIGSRVKG